MGFDNAYEAITEENDQQRWAFGTGFHDPLADVDTAVPDGVDPAALAAYCIQLADDALIMSHRLQEWCTNAPELEEEVALANIGLDLLGQARLFYTRAGAVDGSGHDEDWFAFARGADEFRNVRLVELPRGDFADEMARLLVFSAWRLAILDRLRLSRDPVLAAVAGKGAKEVTFHRDYAAGWVVRLGDGTEYSHARMEQALNAVWPTIEELFSRDGARELVDLGIAIDPADTRPEFDAVMDEVLAVATLSRPAEAGSSGRRGEHLAEFQELLDELQGVARAHPGATW